MTIKKENFSKRVHYNSLTLESTLKARVQFISKFKNRFTRSEVEGVLRTLIGCNKEKWNDLITKHFRKCGNEYEIKLIIPK